MISHLDNVFAGIYTSRAKPDSGTLHGDASRYSGANDNGFLGNVNSFGNQPLPNDESISFSAASEPSRLLDPRLEGSKKSIGSITSKRLKQEFPRVLQRMPSSARYPKNAPPVP